MLHLEFNSFPLPLELEVNADIDSQEMKFNLISQILRTILL